MKGDMMDCITLFTRFALALGFLSAVADRFGLWSLVLDSDKIAWGNMQSFINYTGTLLFYLPSGLVSTLAWVTTIAELLLGVLLLAGVWLKYTAFLSGILLLLFALAMFASLGVKAPFDYSVFIASACAFLLYKQYSLKNC